jgi:hypothetical protein
VTLMPTVHASSGLAKKKLTGQDLEEWREYIEQIAQNFVAGEAKVDPRDREKTCANCGLQTLCRIVEFEAAGDDDSANDEEDGDE